MTRLSRENWLEQGLRQLTKHGKDSITIDGLCTTLGVTKGSFYHHFKNLQAFLEAILHYWEDNFTARFITTSAAGKTPEERLQRLMELVIASYGTEEIAIRAWAQVDPLARAYQQRVDTRRLEYLYELQLAIHADPIRARTIAQLQYTVLLGSSAMLPPLTREELTRIYQLIETQFKETNS